MDFSQNHNCKEIILILVHKFFRCRFAHQRDKNTKANSNAYKLTETISCTSTLCSQARRKEIHLKDFTTCLIRQINRCTYEDSLDPPSRYTANIRKKVGCNTKMTISTGRFSNFFPYKKKNVYILTAFY